MWAFFNGMWCRREHAGDVFASLTVTMDQISCAARRVGAAWALLTLVSAAAKMTTA